MEAWQIWLLAGIAMLVSEIFVPGIVMGLAGVACFTGAIAAGLGLGLAWQLGICLLVLAIEVALLRPVVLRWLHDRRGEHTNLDAVIHAPGKVIEAIPGDSGFGQVKVGGEAWAAVSANGEAIAEGAKVKVLKIKGNKLVVEIPS